METANNGISNLVIFSGVFDDWEAWSVLFHAHAVVHGYDAILDETGFPIPGKTEVRMIDPKTKDPTQLETLRLYRLNSLAMVHLMNSMNWNTDYGKYALHAVIKSRTLDQPMGNARKAFQNLNSQYHSAFGAY
jgi:hypothetical protein